MEVRIELLTVILVGMNTNFVVMGGVVFPLWNWLDVQKLHE
jgi:hypothetical protein